MPENQRIIAGAMSGTSADGVDVALVRIKGRGMKMSAELLHQGYRPYPGALRQAISQIRGGTPLPISIFATIAREISLSYAAAVNETLLRAGMSASAVSAIAAHGQTLYHDPPDTLQSIDPALLATEVGCAVVSDFRRADCSAGGQGAPLVPLADFLLFRHPERSRVLLNLGGIANLTYLKAGGSINEVIAFDTGPGNCTSDYLMSQFDPNGPGWDTDGKIAASGIPVYPLVKHVMSAAYFSKAPPKSTDGPAMIRLFTDAQRELGRRYPIEYLLRSACLITADTILQSIRQFVQPFPDELIISGGGTRNHTLMQLLRQPLGSLTIRSTDELGIPSSAKEAVAFALLGAATLDGEPGNVPSATGARRKVVLGAITPKP